MKINAYLKSNKISRAAFAKKIGTTVNYINNLCLDPSVAGKHIVSRIIKATKGQVSYEDMWPKK